MAVAHCHVITAKRQVNRGDAKINAYRNGGGASKSQGKFKTAILKNMTSVNCPNSRRHMTGQTTSKWRPTAIICPVIHRLHNQEMTFLSAGN